MKNATRICITDIGSTSTKAILISKKAEQWTIEAIHQCATTVEEPFMDVRIGVYNAIKGLEETCGSSILLPTSKATKLIFEADVAFFSTSSAGGGLQILVIGLTLSDSANSAKRASYGAGGVILDTFAIDDGRSGIEKMLTMRKLQPDMILLSGGTENGAISGVLRLAELLRIANPKPKYHSDSKIPMLYAGNSEAVELIKGSAAKSFDLHILPNLRPDMLTENLKPTQELIQKIFLENVMEQAPGYKDILHLTDGNIIPTPIGVMNALKAICKDEKRNIFAFDIGGATTDVFSYINSHFHRTVSANLGMSYSALNVLKESTIAKITKWLPSIIDEEECRNYIGNKSINPTYNPSSDRELMIEHALAKEALRMSLVQHREMHYNTTKVGFLDRLKEGKRDKYELQFNYNAFDETFSFFATDIEVILGAGGVFSHCTLPMQAAMILIDSIRPKGITEIWTDKHFVTPHLGILAQEDPAIAEYLLKHECIQKHVLHISPLFNAAKKPFKVLSIEIKGKTETIVKDLHTGDFLYIPADASMRSINLKSHSNSLIFKDQKEHSCQSDLPIIIDCRYDDCGFDENIYESMHLYSPQSNNVGMAPLNREILISSGIQERLLELPYQGEILVKAGERVNPDTLIAQNRFSPPRLYVLNSYQNLGAYDPASLAHYLKVQPGEIIDADQKLMIVDIAAITGNKTNGTYTYYSPVRGKVEFVNKSNGIVVLSEIQDYATKPIYINVASMLGIKPSQIRSYMQKSVGDFVYRGDGLARRMITNDNAKVPTIVRSPQTGTIKDIDNKSGEVTICYDKEPSRYHANVYGTIRSVIDQQSAELEYKGTKLECNLGFGSDVGAPLLYVHNPEELSNMDIRDKVICFPHTVELKHLMIMQERCIKALILNTISGSLLSKWLQYDPGLLNTGHEKLIFSLILVSGFGDLPMPADVRDFFVKANSKHIYLDPHTRIRAGVQRPFVCEIE